MLNSSIVHRLPESKSVRMINKKHIPRNHTKHYFKISHWDESQQLANSGHIQCLFVHRHQGRLTEEYPCPSVSHPFPKFGGFSLNTHYYGLNVCPPHSYVDALIPSVMVLGNEAEERWSGLGEVIGWSYRADNCDLLRRDKSFLLMS